jgi:dihydrofolate reductase
MRLTAILAISTDGAIGQTTSPTGMPWPRLSADLRRFRDATMGRVCIVGRKTYDGLPPLPGRRLAVLTRDRELCFPPHPDPKAVYAGAMPPQVMLSVFRLREEEVMVIGGAEVYRALLPSCDRVLLTEVRATYPEADVRLGSVADITHGLRCLSRETLGPDESTPVGVVFSEWVRD